MKFFAMRRLNKTGTNTYHNKSFVIIDKVFLKKYAGFFVFKDNLHCDHQSKQVDFLFCVPLFLKRN